MVSAAIMPDLIARWIPESLKALQKPAESPISIAPSQYSFGWA